MSWKEYSALDGLANCNSYHTINLIIHWINAVLVYLVSLSLIKRVWPAAFVALLFAAHPITTETVTNIIGRADMFAAVTVFGGLLLYIRSKRSPNSWALPWVVGLSLMTLFGVFSKESSAALVLVAIVYDVVYRWRRDNHEVTGMAPLVGHGMLYLAAIAALVALPAAIGLYAGSTHLLKDMEFGVRAMISLLGISLGLGLYISMARTEPQTRVTATLLAGPPLMLASCFLHTVPAVVGLVIVLIELFRASMTSTNRRYRVVAHATLYLAIYGALIAIPVAALWVFQHAGWSADPASKPKLLSADAPLLSIFRSLGWDEWLPWYVRLPVAMIPLIGGLCLHFATIRQPRGVRVLALLGVVLLSIGASFFSYWMGILLGLTVATHELILGSLLPPAENEEEYRRDWKLIFHGFSLGYVAMIPPLLAMFLVRAWLFANNTPAEEPFLDNPIRGMWMVQELGMSSFEEQLKIKPMPGLTFIECKLTAVKVMGKLMYLLSWPATLCSDYSFDEFPNFSWSRVFGMESAYRQYVKGDHDEEGKKLYRLHQWEDWKTIVALMTLFSVLGLAAYHYRRNRAICFLILFFFAASLPTSNFIITIGSIMAERFMYLPLAGFTGVVVLAVFAVARWLWNSLKLRDPRDSTGGWGWSNALAGGFLSVVVCVYGARAYFRNYVWISDLTLWKDAIQTSTRSFRCYQSLAFAYFEQDARGYVDKMIDLDETGVGIVDRLPNHLNSSRMYLHLGMYYTIKAGLMCPADQNGNPITTPDSLVWYRKAVEVLERGSEIDRSFDELNRTKQLRRGDPAWKIADVGLTPIYDVLAGAYLQMGMFDEAYRRVIYQRQLDPGDGSIYIRLAGIELARNHPREAAIALIQAILLDSTNEAAWRALIKLYDQFGPEGRGGIIIQGNIVKLNEQNSLMRQQMYEAYRDLVRMFRRSRKWDLAAQARRAAVDVYHFDPKLFDPLFDEPVEFVTPQGVQYDKTDSLITAEDLKMLPR